MHFSHRYNMNTFSEFSDAQLFRDFFTLTGLRGDLAIPSFLRSDAAMFFANFRNFKKDLPNCPLQS